VVGADGCIHVRVSSMVTVHGELLGSDDGVRCGISEAL
jgi:hypothetical protein